MKIKVPLILKICKILRNLSIVIMIISLSLTVFLYPYKIFGIGVDSVQYLYTPENLRMINVLSIMSSLYWTFSTIFIDMINKEMEKK